MKKLTCDNRFLATLQSARAAGISVGAFNFFDYASANAIVAAGEAANQNIILQISASTVLHYGPAKIAAYVLPLIDHSTIKAALHLDHCRNADLAKECVRCGWDAVMMDYSALPFEENVKKTLEMSNFSHDYGVAVEGEIGMIQGVEDDISNTNDLRAGFEETLRFIELSGIDAVAPAIGTAHGVYTGTPTLDFDLVEKLGKQACPVVIHGGTGLEPQVFQSLTKLGAAKINISTALKQSYLAALQQAAQLRDWTPIGANDLIHQAMKETILSYIKTFSGERS